MSYPHRLIESAWVRILTALKIVCAILCGSRLLNIDEYDNTDIGAAEGCMPATPGLIPGIAAESLQHNTV